MWLYVYHAICIYILSLKRPVAWNKLGICIQSFLEQKSTFRNRLPLPTECEAYSEKKPRKPISFENKTNVAHPKAVSFTKYMFFGPIFCFQHIFWGDFVQRVSSITSGFKHQGSAPIASIMGRTATAASDTKVIDDREPPRRKVDWRSSRS